MKTFVLTTVGLLLAASQAMAEVKTKTVEYSHGDTSLKGYLAWDDAVEGKRPGILVVHEWWGLNDYARQRAERLARMGYVAFACDMYGEGKVTTHPKEAGEMAGAVRKNVKEWQGRAQAGLKILQQDERVDTSRLAAIGYCFGGSTALQLAYTGADLDAVVTFHGALPVPTEKQAQAIKARLLICHGAIDGFIPETTIQEVRAALEKAHVDYQMIYYGGARHSFTVPTADKAGLEGLAYDAKADKRSWRSMKMLFDEVFSTAR